MTVAAVGLLILTAPPAWPHGLVERYSLPLPLWLYLTGAGAVVALSFLLVGLLAQRNRTRRDYPHLDLAAPGGSAGWAGRVLLLAGRALSVGLLVLVVLAGLAGSQSPFHNIAPVLVWDAASARAASGLEFVWLEAIAVDRSTPLRGIAVVTAARARTVPDALGIASYAPVTGVFHK